MTAAYQLRSVAARARSFLFRCSIALSFFDTEIIDGAGPDRVARLMRAGSSILIWCESNLVEIPANFVAGLVWALSIPVRMVQSGRMQGYMLSIVIGLIAILGYCLHLAR
jgi:hypothetical protein